MVALLFFGMSCGDNQDANDNANLSSLSLSGVQIDAFSADTLNYTASVDNSVTQITVTAVAADSNASVDIEPDSPVDLDVGENTIKITVTAADGMTEKIYTVTVTRAQLQSPPPPPPAPENNNANLSSLSLSGVQIDAFSADTLNYTASVDNSVTQITVTAVAADSNASVNIEPDSSVDLDVGENTIKITVTAADGMTEKIYTVTVTRAQLQSPPPPPPAPENNNANLSSLSLSGVQIDAFSADTLNYTASVDNSVTQITVTVVAADSNATVNIEPDSPVDLGIGENTIKITVTAADGMTEKIYTVTVTRAQLQSPPPPPPSPENNNANLSSLSLLGVQIDAFSADTLNYTASVDNSVTQITVTAVAADSNATVDIEPDSPVDLNVGENIISITVTAADGMTEKIYTVTVTRAVLSRDGDLRIGGNTPGEGLLEIYLNGIWGTVCDNGFDENDAIVACRQLGFSGGTPTFNSQGAQNRPALLKNVSCDGSEARLIDCPYSNSDPNLNCVTGVACLTQNNNADLSILSLSAIRIGTFSSDKLGYTASVDHSVTQTIVSAIATDNNARVNINPSPSVNLDVGENTISITVTAADTMTQRTYTVTVTRRSSLASSRSDGDLRIIENEANAQIGYLEGLLEIYYNGSWGTICDDNFFSGEAMIACRQLGLSGNSVIDDEYAGTGDIVLKNVSCDGTEAKLIDCDHSKNPNCFHFEDIGLRCDEPENDNANLSSLSLSDIRIDTFSAAADSYAASVDNSVTQTTVNAVAADSDASVAISPGSSVNLDVGENTISITVTAADTMTQRTYTVTVTRTAPSGNGNLRITGGENQGEGLLQIYHDGNWGTVCDDHFDKIDAVVACRQLGLFGGTVIKRQYQGAGADIVLDDVSCDGSETRLIDCSHNSNPNCFHFEDIGVRCDEPENDNANLSSLSLSDIQIDTFSATVNSYAASVDNSVTQTTVSAVAADSDASVAISPGSSVNLNVGENIISITVTAENGTTKKIYTVTVTRRGSG